MGCRKASYSAAATRWVCSTYHQKPRFRVVARGGSPCDNSVVGLEDRDWFRENPSGAWKSRWEPNQRESIPLRRFGKLLLMSVLVVGGLMAYAIYEYGLGDGGDDRFRSVLPLGLATPPPLPSESHVVHLAQSPELERPATRVTRWSVTDPRFGKVTVEVPVGKIPRDAVASALAKRGYRLALS